MLLTLLTCVSDAPILANLVLPRATTRPCSRPVLLAPGGELCDGWRSRPRRVLLPGCLGVSGSRTSQGQVTMQVHAAYAAETPRWGLRGSQLRVPHRCTGACRTRESRSPLASPGGQCMEHLLRSVLPLPSIQSDGFGSFLLIFSLHFI